MDFGPPTPQHNNQYPHTPVPPTPEQTFEQPQPIHTPVHHYEQPVPIQTPEPIANSNTLVPSQNDQPVAVVKVLSVRGVEYAMMTFMLWFGSTSLAWILVSLINGMADFDMLAFPLSLLLISLPVFAFLFIRLKKAELRDSQLKYDASKRRFSQLTQFLAFLTVIFNLVALLYTILQKIGGDSGDNLLKDIGSTAVILVIAGGILAYYWFDEHRRYGR